MDLSAGCWGAAGFFDEDFAEAGSDDPADAPNPPTNLNRSMTIQQSVEVRNGVCIFRPQGECTLVHAVELVRSAIAHCRHQQLVKLLVDGRGLVGIPIPSLVDRFLMAEEWANEAKGLVVMVLVVDAQYIRPDRFGVRVAAHLGLTANVFTSEADALEWIAGASSGSDSRAGGHGEEK